MLSLRTPADVRDACQRWRKAGEKLAFVPTMGALHAGHLSLVETAKARADRVIVSIFINPLQFGPSEDFANYPRMIEEDKAKLAAAGVDAVFLPSDSEMYPTGYQTYIFNDSMADVLCGKYRPGHFQGVFTVLAKLFHLVHPNLCIFGKKDYQQFRLIAKMVEDLMFDMEIVGGDTLRESDGLAMSSRNLRILPLERPEAVGIYQSMRAVQERYAAGERNKTNLLEAFLSSFQRYPRLQLQYVEIRAQKTLDEFEGQVDQPSVILVAAHLGSVRLIDNLELSER